MLRSKLFGSMRLPRRMTLMLYERLIPIRPGNDSYLPADLPAQFQDAPTSADLETSICFQKRARDFFTPARMRHGCLSFMGRIVPVSGPVAQRDFGQQVIAQLLVVFGRAYAVASHRENRPHEIPSHNHVLTRTGERHLGALANLLQVNRAFSTIHRRNDNHSNCGVDDRRCSLRHPAVENLQEGWVSTLDSVALACSSGWTPAGPHCALHRGLLQKEGQC